MVYVDSNAPGFWVVFHTVAVFSLYNFALLSRVKFSSLTFLLKKKMRFQNTGIFSINLWCFVCHRSIGRTSYLALSCPLITSLCNRDGVMISMRHPVTAIWLYDICCTDTSIHMYTNTQIHKIQIHKYTVMIQMRQPVTHLWQPPTFDNCSLVYNWSL